MGNFILDNPYYVDEKLLLQYEVALQLQDTNWKYHLLNLTALGRTLTLSQLYANQDYKIRVRMRVLQDRVLWNVPYINSFRTKPVEPITPPTTVVGAYYANKLNAEVQLFWQPIPKLLHNGSDFTYIVTQVANDKFPLSSSTNESNILLNWNNDLVDYYIQTSNEMGISVSYSHIRVYEQSNTHKPSGVTVVYANNTYTIYWQAPLEPDVLNYTVLWCTSKVATNNQCKGSAHFEYINADCNNFTLPMEDAALNIAIAANFIDYSSGLEWSSCAADENTDLWQLEPEIYEVQSNELKLQWSAGSVCNIIIKGYNITYCEMLAPAEQQICHSIDVKNEAQYDFMEYTIDALKPNTQYAIIIYMYSQKKVGPVSNRIVGKTAEAAPSSPHSLRVVSNSITSNSVNISWLPPLHKNGHIHKYTIWYGARYT